MKVKHGERTSRVVLGSVFPLLLTLAVVTLLLVGTEKPAQAATFAVTSTSDVVDSNTLDGVCNDGFGNCTLRAAIMQANALPGADTVTVPAGTYTLSIAGAGEDAGASGDLDIGGYGGLTINGGGAATTIIDGADLDRVFEVLEGAIVISGLTIQNGSIADTSSGGGIRNTSALTLNNSVVRGNIATSGVFGVQGVGGGIESGGVGAVLTLNNSTVSGNTATYSAGGIHTAGTVILNSSTLSGNTSGNDGGGISIISDGGSATLNNSTVSGNTASHGGGGISGGPVTLNSSTVSGNTAGYPALGGGVFNQSGSLTMKNTILANNSVTDCGNAVITSAGHNLIENTSGCAIGGITTGNVTGVDPVLGALANNGGVTRTHALLAGSPAINAGSPDCPPPTADQRGAARPQGGACDIGSFEFSATSRRYCIYGQSTGVGWTWAVTGFPGFFSGNVSNGTVTPGSSAMQIANEWVSSMNAAFGGALTATQLTGNQAHCFRITPGNHSLKVNACTVTISGCSFNPEVFEEDPVGGLVELHVSGAGPGVSASSAAYPVRGSSGPPRSFSVPALWCGRRRWSPQEVAAGGRGCVSWRQRKS